MVQAEVLCLIPEKLLEILQQNDILGPLFRSCDEQKYKNMMVHVIGQIFTDEPFYLGTHHMFFTLDQKNEWLKCFRQALHELNLDTSCEDILYHKVEKAVQVMSLKESVPICEYLSDAISHAENPQKVVNDVKHFLNNQPLA